MSEMCWELGKLERYTVSKRERTGLVGPAITFELARACVRCEEGEEEECHGAEVGQDEVEHQGKPRARRV